MKYAFHPYHKYFIKRAQEEIGRLSKILPESKIEHFGSTSIPGVGGKGIIDLFVSVSKEKLNKTSLLIQRLGYEFKLSGGIPNERLYHKKTTTYKDGHKQTFHLHLTYFDSEDWKRSIAFRDFLRKNPELAKEYSEIKHKAVFVAKNTRRKKDKKEAYMNAKRPVIEKIIKSLKI